MKAVYLLLFFFVLTTSSLEAITTFPQLALGGGYQCILLVSNKSDSNWEGTVTAYKGDFEEWTVGWRYNRVLFGGRSELSISLPPFASRKIEIFGDQSVRAGFLRVRDTGENDSTLDLAFTFFYNFVDDREQLLDSTGVAPADVDRDFWIPVEMNESVNTGFAVIPLLSFSSLEITLNLYDRDGNLVGTEVVEATGHVAKFFSEVFKDLPDEFIGMLHLNAPGSFYLTALRLETTADGGFQLTSVPPDNFKP